MEIKIPKRLEEKLERDDQASIFNLASNTKNYFTLSPFFFPEYTIHGVDHIDTVMDFADKLIPEDTLEQLDSRAVAFLLAGIILHDIGMFITIDGFNELIGESSSHGFEDLDDRPWREAWEAFKRSVINYNGTELQRLFGSPDPIFDIITDKIKMRRADVLACGEFVRKNHPRIAHEIAAFGFMGAKTVDVFEGTMFNQSERDLIGLLARSHGMELRATESYVENHFGRSSSPLAVPVFYLMAVLRIADYLDAGQHRAPREIEMRETIDSTTSKKEWEWNQAVDSKGFSWEYSSSILNIYASPKKTSLFIKIEDWLKSIQKELDTSWGVIEEKYPDKRRHLRLSIHRIGSNLLDRKTRETFAKHFVIHNTQLTVNPEIVKLLIRPLYGDRATYGVRELLQNAVDACNEREHLEKSKSYKGRITIKVDTKSKTFSIEDNGIGMSEEILRDYFLNIGASYRDSSTWRNAYTQERQAKITRSGRFGIGILAVFLLGQTAEVKTRYMKDEQGLEFIFTSSPRQLDIERIKQKEPGTTITIKLSDQALEQLKSEIDPKNKPVRDDDVWWYQWYWYKSPSISYFVDDKEIYPEKEREYIPSPAALGEHVVSPWHKLSNSSYTSICYNILYYDARVENRLYPGISCNGFFITGRPYAFGIKYGYEIGPLLCSVEDRDAKLQLNLARSSIEGLGEEDDLAFYRTYLPFYVTCWVSRIRDVIHAYQSQPAEPLLFGTLSILFLPNKCIPFALPFFRIANISRFTVLGTKNPDILIRKLLGSPTHLKAPIYIDFASSYEMKQFQIPDQKWSRNFIARRLLNIPKSYCPPSVLDSVTSLVSVNSMKDKSELGDLLTESDHAYSVELAPWKDFEDLLDLKESASIVKKALGGNVWIPFSKEGEAGDESNRGHKSA